MRKEITFHSEHVWAISTLEKAGGRKGKGMRKGRSRLGNKEQGEPRRCEKLYLEYRNRMYFWAFSIVRDEMEAEDIVVSIMTRLTKRKLLDEIAKMSDSMSHRNLEAMTISTAINWDKKTKKPSKIYRMKGSAGSLFQNCGKDLERISEGMSGERLTLEIGRLSAVEANLLGLKYVDRFKNRDISRIIGVPGAIAGRQIARAEMNLMKLLEAAAEGEGRKSDKREVAGNE